MRLIKLIGISLLVLSFEAHGQSACIKRDLLQVKECFVEAFGKKVYENLSKNERNRIHLQIEIDTTGNLIDIPTVDFFITDSDLYKLDRELLVNTIKKTKWKFCVFNPEAEISRIRYFQINNYRLKYDLLLFPNKI